MNEIDSGKVGWPFWQDVHGDKSPSDKKLMITRTGAYVQLTPAAHFTVRLIQQGVRRGEFPQNVPASSRKSTSTERLMAIYDRVLQQITVLEARSNANTPWGIWGVTSVISESAVFRIAAGLACFFKPWIAIPATILICTGLLCGPSIHSVRSSSGEDLLFAFLLYTVSLVFHEFGHAAACAYFGMRPKAVGFAFYLCYPVFYCDVSPSWELPAIRRIVVDGGGIYLQLLSITLLNFVYWCHPFPAIPVLSKLSWFTVLLSLNPLMRYDGYWILADALDLPNLSSLLSLTVARLFGRRRDMSHLSALKGYRLGVVVLYMLATVVFWEHFIASLLPRAARNVLQILQAMTMVATKASVSITIELIVSVTCLGLVSITIFRIFLRFVQLVQRTFGAWRSSSG